MKHTPGPWIRQYMRDGTGHDMITVVEDKRGPQREICRSYDLDDESVANMRIVENAAELLDTLAEWIDYGAYRGGDSKQKQDLIRRTSELVKKARGAS